MPFESRGTKSTGTVGERVKKSTSKRIDGSTHCTAASPAPGLEEQTRPPPIFASPLAFPSSPARLQLPFSKLRRGTLVDSFDGVASESQRKLKNSVVANIFSSSIK